jgi:predicted RNase H-like HicB family nuclease
MGKLKEIPEVFSQGKSLHELEENIRDAYYLMVEEREGPPVETLK